MKRVLVFALPVLLVLAVWLRPRPIAGSATTPLPASNADPRTRTAGSAPAPAAGADRPAVRVPPPEPAKPRLPVKDTAFLGSLRDLLRTQNEDGSWGRETDYLEGVAVDPVGATSLALLSFLGAGYTHLSKDDVDGLVVGASIKKALQWLMDRQQPDGTIPTSGDPTLNQALAALALAENFGMTGSNLFKDSSAAAVAALAGMQGPDGSWGDPVRSAWSSMALVSSRLSDIPLAPETLERAQAAAAAAVDAHRSPKALVSHLFLNKEKTRPSVETAASWLAALPPDWSQQDFSYWYFGSLALYQLDGPSGDTWKAWSPRLKDTLLKFQDKSGAWTGSTGTGTVIRTSLGTMTLEVFYRYTNVFAAK